jgi:hypothetical protein
VLSDFNGGRSVCGLLDAESAKPDGAYLQLAVSKASGSCLNTGFVGRKRSLAPG